MAPKPGLNKGQQSSSINVDFAALAIQDPDFAKVYNSVSGRVDFQDPETLQQLTKSLLKRDFNLALALPADRLCPPVPIRFEYIRWIQDLLDTTAGPDATDMYDPERHVIGIDIGVGASCIYPLLGCAARPNWRFGGTEVDDASYDAALQNVHRNELQSRIRLRKTDPHGPILVLKELGIARADFVMCNPPFFTSKEDMAATFEKGKPPSAICTGAEVEMITEGGDVGFVLRMVKESKALGERVQWYSSMLGKLHSVSNVVAGLKEIGVSNWAVTTLRAGSVTRRWAVAWSFGDLRPRNDVARRDMTINNILPFPTEFRINSLEQDISMIASSMNECLANVNVDWAWDEKSLSGICFATENVWSRSARRKHKRENPRNPDPIIDPDEEENEPMLGVRISIATADAMVTIRWFQGLDSVLFESFCGMVKRALAQSYAGKND